MSMFQSSLPCMTNVSEGVVYMRVVKKLSRRGRKGWREGGREGGGGGGARGIEGGMEGGGGGGAEM